MLRQNEVVVFSFFLLSLSLRLDSFYHTMQLKSNSTLSLTNVIDM